MKKIICLFAILLTSLSQSSEAQIFGGSKSKKSKIPKKKKSKIPKFKKKTN